MTVSPLLGRAVLVLGVAVLAAGRWAPSGIGAIHPIRTMDARSASGSRPVAAPAPRAVDRLEAMGLVFGPVRDASAGSDASTGSDASAGSDTTTATVALPKPPRCRHGDQLARIDPDAPELTLLDWRYRLPKGWRPADLVPVSEAGLGGGGSIAAAAIPDLTALVRAARTAGIRLWARSAYRDEATQAWTFATWERLGGIEMALRSSARPGHSEHQLGTAIDFTSLSAGDPWTGPDWGRTPAGRWMLRNAHRYGWVLSFPRGATGLTCFRYEPWHWRWVGREVARAIVLAKVPPRVWLWWQRPR